MMGAVRRWLLGIILTAFAGGTACRIAPEGREQAGVRLVSGLLLLLAALGPLGRIFPSNETAEAGRFFSGPQEIEARCQEERVRALGELIEEKTEAYICDKASDLGIALEARVTTSIGEEGVPLPNRVFLRGPYSEEMSGYLREEVGIPTENQFWQEGDYGP